MQVWLKDGIINGFKSLCVFLTIALGWAFAITAAQNYGFSPGWPMLIFFSGAIFYFSILSEKTKYEMEKKLDKVDGILQE
jgi:hypothetical protein